MLRENLRGDERKSSKAPTGDLGLARDPMWGYVAEVALAPPSTRPAPETPREVARRRRRRFLRDHEFTDSDPDSTSEDTPPLQTSGSCGSWLLPPGQTAEDLLGGTALDALDQSSSAQDRHKLPSGLGHGDIEGNPPGGGHPPVSGSSSSALAHWVPGQDAWGAVALQSMWDAAQQFLELPIARKKKSTLKSPPAKKGVLKSRRFLAKRRDAPHVQPSLGAKKRIASERTRRWTWGVRL